MQVFGASPLLASLVNRRARRGEARNRLSRVLA
nr:MAG TPA: hypothetical protein [Caudoviricetes sp.]